MKSMLASVTTPLISATPTAAISAARLIWAALDFVIGRSIRIGISQSINQAVFERVNFPHDFMLMTLCVVEARKHLDECSRGTLAYTGGLQLRTSRLRRSTGGEPTTLQRTHFGVYSLIHSVDGHGVTSRYPQ